MTRKHIITIAGKIGGGKSSTAQRVAELLGYEHSSTGSFMRKLALERKISLEELSKEAEKDDSIDRALDEYNKEIGQRENIVLDSRLGFYFIPESYKVFLELDPKIAAGRILKDKEKNSDREIETNQEFNTEESIYKTINQRLESERKRYKELYNILDHTDHKNFDLVIDTSQMPLEDVVQKIVKDYKKWLII